MKSALSLLALAGAATASDVVVGTTDNFAGLVSEGVVLSEFYAPWCGHCKKLAPEWEKAATALKGKATLVKVDCTVEDSVCSKYGVQGYPTIKAFIEGGDAIEYDGGRVEPEIISWVTKMTGPAVTEIADAAALTAAQEANRVLVTGFFASADSEEAKDFEKLAKANRMSFVFSAVYDAALAKAEGVSAPAAVVYKQFDDGKNVMEKFVVEELITFAAKAAFPIFDEIGPDNYKNYVDRALPIAWLFIDEAAEAETDAAKKAVAEVCKEHVGAASCVWLSGVKYGQMAERIGLSGKKFPCFGIDNEGEHFAFDEAKDVTADNLAPWMKEWASGKLAPTVKSEPVPEEATVEGLTTLVGDSIKEIAFDAKKNVLIKFYAPWCGHCKQMAPDYAKVAADFKDDESVIVADFDATTNDAPKDFKVEGFPTLYWKAAGAEFEQFNAGRDYDAIKSFIEKNKQ